MQPVPWSPLQDIDFNSVPVNAETHKNSLFMEDTAWPFKGGLQAYLAKAGTLYDHTLSSQKEEGTGMIELEAAFQPVFGTHQTTEVILWQRVVNTKAVMWMLGHDLPPEASAPGTWLHDALEVRDQWESRLCAARHGPRSTEHVTTDGDAGFDGLRPQSDLRAFGPGSTATTLPDFEWTAEQVEAYRRRFAADGPDGRLVCIVAQDATWDRWERHPGRRRGRRPALGPRRHRAGDRWREPHTVELRPGEAW